MLDWLAVWLQQIIAVVLLAGFIDLLLPNKGMQRYVRLVAGLIILLTILTPIIRVLQGDFSAKLDAQVEEWIHADPAKSLHMPTLEDIQQDAAALKKKEAASASALAQRQIEAEMKAGIEQSTGLQAASVAVTMKVDRKGQPAQIGSVSVTLAPARLPQPDTTNDEQQQNTETSADGSGEYTGQPVEEVQAVQVNVDSTSGASSPEDKAAEVRLASGTIAAAVKSVLREGWSVNPAIVEVLEQVPAEASAQ
ncbi:stage III sporulation protein AF [Paenibacillus rhizovicinus]|uniref:Stage III sporulation protein AF n=1 Tax=Paenibacillus rhizovicinus TaxID=2704463 RepID=A0A6C0NVR4_9BACL|nr:stage III sporulation protein AF [Paenibacillus rhizovicinus]QHW30285.1 stage III sporulation protein AF [Paenibacillus rhizovicinus]